MATPAPQPADSASFSMSSTAWLKARGIRGKAIVRLAPSGLEITGEEAGILRLLTTQVRRIRTNWVPVKNGPYFLTRIWLENEQKPLKLNWRGHPADAYAAVIRGLAAQLARVDGVSRLQRGSSIATALELLIPMAMLFVAAVAISIVALDGDIWWQRMMPIFAITPFFALGIGLAILRWPRPVRDLAEFNSRVA